MGGDKVLRVVCDLLVVEGFTTVYDGPECFFVSVYRDLPGAGEDEVDRLVVEVVLDGDYLFVYFMDDLLENLFKRVRDCIKGLPREEIGG